MAANSGFMLKEEMETVILADIVVDLRGKGFDHPYTYLVPNSLQKNAVVGALTLAPFGPQQVLGYIVSLRDVCPDDVTIPKGSLKSLIDILHAPPLDGELFELAKWLSDEYVAGLGSSLHTIVPPAARSRLRAILELISEPIGKLSDIQVRIINALNQSKGIATVQSLKRGIDPSAFSRAAKQLRDKGIIRQTFELVPPSNPSRGPGMVRLAASEDRVDDFLKEEGRRRPAQVALLMKLLDNPEGAMPQSELLSDSCGNAEALKRLEEDGLVTREADQALPDESAAAPRLSRGQSTAVKALAEALAKNEYNTFLLYGVTASGKTEVYLRAAAECLRLAKECSISYLKLR
ncbi:MAG: hypothetical protein WCO51_04485 [bacterium]